MMHNINPLWKMPLRQIGMFQDMYDAIMKNNNIPENWSEKDYEISGNRKHENHHLE
jgi:hypothetical protein